MAVNMLLLGADEVARNGAFGKILRPEVFPNAPLQIFRLTALPFDWLEFVADVHSAPFTGPPPRAL